MKSKKPIFNTALYLDTIRQIKISGIITAVILLGLSVAVPIMYLLGGMYYDEADHLIFSTQILSMFDTNAACGLLVYFMGPIMVLQSFSFLNKRNASDFYHSIPNTRLCLYLTHFAAAFTWVLGILLSTSLISAILTNALPKMSMIGSSVGYFLLTEIACALLTMGVTALAAALSGTTVSSVFITGVILFVPRLLLTLTKTLVSGSLPYVADQSYGIILNGSYNLITARWLSLENIFFISKPLESYVNIYSLLYTFILALIYLCLGGLFFIRRKSEAAGKAAANRGIQAVFRMVTAFLFCIPCIGIIYDTMQTEGDINRYELISRASFLIAFYVCAIIAYFVYELITTRKWRNLLRVAPGLLVLAGINVVVLVGLNVTVSYYKGQQPEERDISYVSVMPTVDDFYFYYIENNGEEYFSSKAGEARLISDEAKKLISDQLVFTIGNWDQQYHYPEDYSHITVKIHYHGKNIYRYVLVTDKQMETLLNEMEKNDDIRTLYMNLPEEGKNSTDYYFNNEAARIPKDGVRRIVEAYREDIQDMGFEKWYPIINSSDIYYSDAMLYGVTVEGLTRYSLQLPIGANTPKAYAAYAEEMNKLNVAKREELIQTMYGDVNINTDNLLYADVSVYISDPETYNSSYWNVFSYYGYGNEYDYSDYYSKEEKELFKELADYLAKQDDSFFTNITAGSAFLELHQSSYIEYETSDIYSENYSECSLYIPMDDTVKDIWSRWMEYLDPYYYEDMYLD